MGGLLYWVHRFMMSKAERAEYDAEVAAQAEREALREERRRGIPRTPRAGWEYPRVWVDVQEHYGALQVALKHSWEIPAWKMIEPDGHKRLTDCPYCGGDIERLRTEPSTERCAGSTWFGCGPCGWQARSSAVRWIDETLAQLAFSIDELAAADEQTMAWETSAIELQAVAQARLEAQAQERQLLQEQAAQMRELLGGQDEHLPADGTPLGSMSGDDIGRRIAALEARLQRL